MLSEQVCIGKAYADGEDMRMHDICRCQAYGYATPIHTSYLFPLRSENSRFRIFKKSFVGQRPAGTVYGASWIVFHHHVVFLALIVTRRAAADIAALLIPCAWYTSGKL